MSPSNSAGESTLYDLSSRTSIEVSGKDRAAILHNLCTNDVRSLLPGQGCEAFFTTVQGKIVGHAFLFCDPDAIIIDTVPGQTESIMSHIDRYVIREDVGLRDRTSERGAWLLVGDGAEATLRELSGVVIPPTRLAHVAARLADYDVVLRRVDLAGPHGILVECDSAQRQAVGESLLALGVKRGTDAEFDAARIEAGMPVYGQDITSANLPQEVTRDKQAIHFAKGCYLGQETVARIDALGHVNKTLCGVRFAGEQVPSTGLELKADDKGVGEVTSAAWSQRLAAPIALAYLRRGHNAPGTRLSSEIGDAEVVTLPFLPAGTR